MKKIILLAVILLSVSGLSAQKKDRTNMGYLKYVQSPLDPLSSDIKTYTFDAEGSYGDDYRRDEIISKFSFAGYEKVESDGDLSIFIKEYDLREGDREQQRKEKKVKKDGVESIVTTYYYTNTFKYKYLLTVKNKNDETIFEKEYSGNKKVTGRDFSSTKTALDDYNRQKSSEKSKILGEGVASVVKSLNSQHGFPMLTMSAVCFKIKPKKFNYDEFNTSVETLMSCVEKSNTGGQKIEEFEADVRNVIAVMEKEIATLEDHKKARMNPDAAAAAYYNITMAYALLKDYDSALTALEKGRALDKNVGDANYVEYKLTDLAKRNKIFKEFLAAN